MLFSAALCVRSLRPFALCFSTATAELLRKLVELEPRNVFAQHATGSFYVRTGNKTGAMQQYYIVKDLDPKLAADLLKLIPK